MGRKKNETFTANDVKKIWSKHYSTGDNKSVTKPETKTETKTSTYTQTEAPKNETFTANDVKKIWNANSGSNTNNDSKVSTPKQTVNNTQKYTGGRKTTATITPTRNRLKNDILANISRNSTPSYEGYTQSNVKTTKHGSLDTNKTDKADSKKKSKETEDESPFNKAFNLPDLTVQQFKEEYGKNPSAFKFKSHIDEDTIKKAAEGDEEARKKAIKEEYENIPERNFFERAANRFTRENATLYGLFPQNLPEDYPNYREDYNRKQELSKEYKKIKYDEAVSDLLGSGFTEEDLKSLNKRVLTQKDIDRLVAEGKTDEEIDRIAEELFEKGENTSRRLYDYTTDKKKNPAGLSFDDYMDAIVEYYTKPALKELAKEKPVMASIDTLFTNPFESIYNVGANGWNYLAGRPLENNPTTADIMREGVNERIGNKLGQIAYGGVMSIGDMAVAQGIDFALGGGGVISAGLQAAEKASQVSNDAVERGLTPNRIFASTIASGVTTFVTEKISMGRLSDIAEHGLTKYSAKEIAKTLGASFVTEGAQEGMEDVADWITGSLISWDKNEFNQAYQAYLESGESKEEAVGHVISDKLVELISDIVMGGIGGGVMGGVNTGLAYAAGKIQTNPHVDTDTVLESDTALNQLIEAVQTIDTTNLSEEFAQRVEHAQEVAQKPSDELTVEDVVDMANAVNEQAGPDNNLAQTIQEINYQANYERNINEYIETGKIEEKENELPIEKAAREQAQLAVKDYTKAALEQQKQAEKDFINNLKSYKKNDWQSDAEVKANTEQRLQEASAYFENETAAKNYIDNYNGQDLGLYTEVSYLAYTAGESGQSFDTFLKNSVEADLMIKHGGVDKGYLKTLFYNGQNARTTDNEVVTLRKNENRGLATNLSPDDQLATFKKAIAKKLNIEVSTNFEDAESRGNFMASVARLVTNSTSDNEYATIIHEMFEFARSYNAKGMELVDRTLTDMLVKKQGERSFVDAVNRYKEVYRSAGKNAPEGSSLKSEANKTFSEAQEEFVNDAASYIFSTEEGMKTLVDYIMDDGSTTAQEKMSAIQTIKTWVDNLITAIKNFLSGHSTDQLAYKYVERLKLSSEELQGISQMLVGALEGARENLAAMTEQGVGESEKVAHQVKVPANETLEDKIKRESDNFEKQLDAWDGVDERKHFVVGTTSEILNKEIGVPNAEIKMDSSKIVKVFKDHPEMKNLLHRIPEILNDPIIIMESRTVADAYVLYGDVFNGKDPVMVSLLIYPKGRNGIALDIHKVSSAYAKDNAQYQLNHSVVKYISPDKKRTAAWNRLTRLQLPFAPTISSSTNNVPQNQPNSKTQSGKTRNSLAVHAGDLGKSEGFWQMTSSNRGTGHFGTGTYFVGDEEQINNYGYEKRPHEKVDFANYNLFTPKTYKQAMDLHESLKFINNNVYSYDILNRLDSLDSDLKDIDKYGYDLFKEENVEKATEELNRLYEIYGKYMSRYDRNRLGDREDYKDEADFLMNFSDYIDSIREGVEDYVEKYEDSVKKLADVLGVSEDTVKDTMMDVFDESAKITDAYKARYEDSPSTRFMKRLGYEGVDVRDIKQMDNVEYGSVIYDLKGEDLKRKQEIGTAKFSLDVPVEETDDLIAIHNLGEEQLKGILELGGFPMPSLAITKADMGHDLYGDISVLFRKDTIDPKKSTKNKVYGGDAWTPTFPRVEAKINEKVASKIRDRIYKLINLEDQRAFESVDLDNDNLEDKINGRKGDVIDAYRNNRGIQYAFLKDQGIELDIPSEDARLDSKFNNDQILAAAKVIKDLKEAENLRMSSFQGYEKNPELVEKLRKALNEQFREKYKSSKLKLLDKDLYEELTFSDFDHLTAGVYKYYRDGIQKQRDSLAARDALKAEMERHENEYEAWLRDLFDGIIAKKGLRNNKELFTYSGNRRSWDVLHDDYTLDNIVKIMSQQEERGEAAFFSQSAIQALSTKKLNSIEEIRKSKGQLRLESEEEHEKRITEQSERFSKICNEIMDKTEKNQFIAFGRASDAIADAIRNSKTVQGIDRELRQWRGLNIQEDTAQKIVDLMKDISENPTGYFEAKPRRAVGLDEVAAVVVPSDDTEIINLLNEKNLPVVEYERGNKQSRIDAVNSVENIKFSLKVTEDSEGRTLSEGQQEYFKDSVVRDDQGRLMVMYHGTPNGDFTVFRGGSYFTNMAWYADRYQNQGASSLGYKKTAKNPKTYAAYLNITKPFDTRDPEIREIWDEQYYQKWDTGNITENGLPDWTAAEGLREFIEENGLDFDGLIIDEGGVPTDDGVLSRGFAWIPLNGGNQVKDINNLNPTPNKDMRFSIDVSSDDFFDSFLEIDEEVKKTESALKEMIDKKMDLDSDISKKMISDVASYIRNKYNSTYKKEWLESSITAIFKFLQNNNVRMEDIMYIMSDIAKPILENVKNANPEQEKLYKDVVNTVKSYKIKLDAGQKQEVINAYGSYKNFVDSMRGKITLSNDGIALDNIWTELVDKTGGGLSYGTVPNDQPIELANLINSLNPTYASLEGQALEDAAMDVSLDIISQFYVHNSMTEAAKAVKGELTKRANKFKEDYKKRYNEALKQVEAEKALNIKRLADEIDNLTAEEQEAIRTGDTVNQVLIENLKKEYKARYERLQAQANEKIARARANYQNSWINKNLRRERSELKNRVLREVKALQNMIAHPQEGASKHVPINLIKPTIEMLEAINLDNGGRNKAIAERLKKMSEVYESFKNDDTYSFDYDERIASDIKELQEMFNNKSYANLGITELQRVIEIVTALKTQIKNANNLILQGKREDAIKMATEAVNEVREGKRTSNLASDRLNKYLNAHLNAKREFRKLAGYVDGAIMKIYNDIEQGFLKETTIQRDLGAIFQGVLEGKENQKEIKRFISAKEKDLVDLGITDESGKPIKITRAMRMSLIMHSMNASNMRHVLGSGIKIPDMKLFAQGKIAEAYAKGETVRFVDYNAFLEAVQKNDQNKINELTKKAQERIENLKNDLSEWEKRYLAASEKMFHEETGKIINETSMAVKGYALARVKNYFPIRTDSDFSKKDWAGLAHDGSIEGMGMLKERVISSKPILLEDITNVTLRQIENVSKYAGYALPMRNFNMVMNTTLDRRNTNGKLVNLLSTIGKEWGKTDTDYLTDLMQDIQGARGESKSFLTSLRGQFAGATLTLNPSVALSQAASYPTAGAVVGFKPLMKAMKDMGKGFVTKKGIEELERINPLLWYRNQGNATQDLKDARNAKLPVVLQKGINWIEFMDTGTVRTLEYASMYYVDENYKNLEKGSEEYWQKVSEVFTRVVTETQPNYSTLHRPSILRTPNSLVKMLTMFKTQALQNFNIVYDALGELNAAKKSDDKDWQKRAAGNFANAVSSQTTALVVFSAIKMLSQLMFHRWYKYRDEDDEWSWEMFLKAFGWQMASTFAGSFLFGSEIFDWIKAKVTKDRYYGIEVSTVEMANDLLSNIRSASDYAEKLGDAKTEEDRETNFKNLMKYVYNIGTTIGEFTGVPVNNIKNMLSSIFFYGADIKEGIESGDFEISNDSDLVKYLTGGDTPTQYERLYEAFENGDTKKYDKLVEELVNKSLTENKEEIKAGEMTADDIAQAVQDDVTDKILKLMKADYLEGNVSEEELTDFLVDEKGKTEDEAYIQIKKWEGGTSSEYKVMNDSVSIAAADPTPENKQKVIDEVKGLVEHGKTPKGVHDSLSKAYKEQYIELYNEGKAADLNSILRAALVAAGFTDEEAKKKLEGWLK